MSTMKAMAMAGLICLVPMADAFGAPGGAGPHGAGGGAGPGAMGGQGAPQQMEQSQQQQQKQKKKQQQQQQAQGQGGQQQQQQQQQDRDRDRDRVGDQGIYGSDLMSEEERTQYRSRLNNAKSDEEKTQLRAEHQLEIQNRARERGLPIPPAKGLSPDQPQPANP
jgi:hypothetical protein